MIISCLNATICGITLSAHRYTLPLYPFHLYYYTFRVFCQWVSLRFSLLLIFCTITQIAIPVFVHYSNCAKRLYLYRLAIVLQKKRRITAAVFSYSSIYILSITTSSRGLSPLPVRQAAILSTTSIPSVSSPNAA